MPHRVIQHRFPVRVARALGSTFAILLNVKNKKYIENKVIRTKSVDCPTTLRRFVSHASQILFTIELLHIAKVSTRLRCLGSYETESTAFIVQGTSLLKL